MANASVIAIKYLTLEGITHKMEVRKTVKRKILFATFGCICHGGNDRNKDLLMPMLIF